MCFFVIAWTFPHVLSFVIVWTTATQGLPELFRMFSLFSATHLLGMLLNSYVHDMQLNGGNGNTNSVVMDDGMMITQLMHSLHMVLLWQHSSAND